MFFRVSRNETPMKAPLQLINEMEAEILERYAKIDELTAEVKSLTQAINTLRGYPQDGPSHGIPANYVEIFPEYPVAGSLWDKYNYLEDINLRFWSKKELDQLIIDIEGQELAEKTLKNNTQKINSLINKGLIIAAKFNNDARFTFYTTRSEFIDYNESGPYIIDVHYPNASLLSRLSSEQRDASRITWSGLELK